MAHSRENEDCFCNQQSMELFSKDFLGPNGEVLLECDEEGEFYMFHLLNGSTVAVYHGPMCALPFGQSGLRTQTLTRKSHSKYYFAHLHYMNQNGSER
jgi:hypothetical protein